MLLEARYASRLTATLAALLGAIKISRVSLLNEAAYLIIPELRLAADITFD